MDPIFTPIFASLLASSFGLSATAAGIGASVLSGIVVTAAGVGLSLLTRPSTPRPENGSFALMQPLPPRIYAYGQCRIAGYVALLECTSWLFQISALVGHRCNAFVQFYLNDDAVSCNAGVTGSVYAGADGRYKNSAISLDCRFGLSTETAYSGEQDNFGFWDASHRGDNVCSLEMTCRSVKSSDFTTVYPYQRPSPSAVIQTALIFDPRDGSQNPDDQNTFKYSTNPALAILHFQCFSPYGPQRDYHAAIAPVVGRWIDEANICDEQVALASGGTEKRYELGGFTDTDKDPRSTLQTMLATCDGWFVERGDGTIILTVGKYRTPTVELTDDDISGFMFQTGMSGETSVNSMVAVYTSAQDDYKSVDTDPIDNVADQTLRGRKNTGRLELTWVQSTGQASRLLVRETVRNAEVVRGRLDLKLSAINAMYERWVLISSSIPRLNGKVIENRKPVISLMGGSCSVEFIGSGSEIDAYNPATQESRPPTIVTRAVASGPPIPSNVGVVVQTAPEGDGSTYTYLVVSFDSPLYNDDFRYDLTFAVFYTTSTGNTTEQDFSSYDPTSGRITLQTGAVPPDDVLSVSVSSKGYNGAQSDQSIGVSVNTAISQTPPDPPQSLAATSGTGHVTLSCTNPNNVTFAGVQFYRSAHGALFTSATAIGSEVFGSPNGSSTYTDTVAAGTYDYWVTSLGRSGARSTATGPTSGTSS